MTTQRVHHLSIVVPVYQGEHTLPALVEAIAQIRRGITPRGAHFEIEELFLVHDCGPDGSAKVIRALAAEYSWVRPIWLSRNYGQHAATLAGIASTGSEWVVTMDEDLEHDPRSIALLLDAAIVQEADLVYAQWENQIHAPWRNTGSRWTKALVRKLGVGNLTLEFSSYRLMLGEIGRSVAAYAGPGIYLDVALSWVSGRTILCEVPAVHQASRDSGYGLRSLLSHFVRLVVSGGTRPLRLLSVTGALSVLVAILIGFLLVIGKLTQLWDAPGWTSSMIFALLSTGAILFALGIIAEYLGQAVNMAMGKPLYLIVRDPAERPYSTHSDGT